ncbi:MAG: ATP-binding protein [Ruminococcus flavefaciens]|nr:ATP-binding protein [Ruminococcus flavefaciens]
MKEIISIVSLVSAHLMLVVKWAEVKNGGYNMEICSVVLGIIGICFFIQEFCQMKMTINKKQRILSMGLFFISVIAFQLSNKMALFAIMGWVLELLAILFLFQTNFKHGCSVFMFSFSYYTVIYYPVELVISAGCKNIVREYKIILAKILTILLIIFIGKLIRKNENLVYNIKKAHSRYLFLAGLCGFLDNGIIYFVDYFTQGVEGRSVTAVKILNAIVNIFVYLLGILLIYIDIIRQRLLEENTVKDKYLQMSREHFREISDHMQEVRRIKHDIKSHINSLGQYLKDENYTGAMSYLARMKDTRIFDTQIMNLVGNQMVDAVISHTLAGHDGIRLQCEGVLPANTGVSDYDLCTIFSNVVSNAAEACERLDKSEKMIEMKIGCYQGNIAIVVRNSIEWVVDVDRLGEITSKEEKQGHGYGIYNIKNTVKKLGGKYFFDINENIFEAKIILKM